MRGRLSPRRVGDTFTEYGYPRDATAIGKLVLAFNDLHEKLAGIFWSLMGDAGYGRAPAVWASLSYDHPKRDMLKAAAKAANDDELKRFPKLTDDIVWLLNQANEIEEVRNNAVHAPLISLGRYGVYPDIEHDNPRALKLEGKDDLLTEFDWCRAKTVVLRNFVMDIDLALRTDGRRPWPDRPQLPNRERRKAPPGRRRLGYAK